MAKKSGWTEVDSEATKLFLHDGDYTAFVTLAGPVKVWLILKGSAVIGHGGGDTSWHEAKDNASRALASCKATDRRPYFADSI